MAEPPAGGNPGWAAERISPAAGPGPTPRWGHAAALLPARQLVVVTGGLGGPGGRDLQPAVDVLHLRRGRWRRADAAEAGAPGPEGPEGGRRAFHSCVELGEGAVLVFGGRTAGGRLCNSCASFDLAAGQWAPVACRGPAPAPREGHGACRVNTTQMVVVGGWGGSGGGPGAAGDAGAGDGAGAGPAVAGQWLGDMHLLDLPSMTWTRVVAEGPAPCLSHLAVARCGWKLVVAGGAGAGGASGAVHSFDLLERAWRTEAAALGVSQDLQVPAAAGASATLVGDRVLVAGGCTGEAWVPPEQRRYNGTCVALDAKTLGVQLAELRGAAAPGPRAYHAAVAIAEDALLLLGGRDAAGVLGEVWLVSRADGPAAARAPPPGLAGAARAPGAPLLHHSLLPPGEAKERARREEELREEQVRAAWGTPPPEARREGEKRELRSG